jgi:hypothetical protein
MDFSEFYFTAYPKECLYGTIVVRNQEKLEIKNET